jgi:hypothetical protein
MKNFPKAKALSEIGKNWAEWSSHSLVPPPPAFKRTCRRLVAGLSPRGPGFDPRSVHVGLVAHRVAMVQVFLLILLSSPVSIIAPMLHLHLHVALTRTREQSLGLLKSNAISEIGEPWMEKVFQFRAQKIDNTLSTVLY